MPSCNLVFVARQPCNNLSIVMRCDVKVIDCAGENIGIDLSCQTYREVQDEYGLTKEWVVIPFHKALQVCVIFDKDDELMHGVADSIGAMLDAKRHGELV